MTAWVVLLLEIVLCFGIAWWGTRPAARRSRPVLVLLCASAVILGFSLYWQPSLGALIALNDARRASITMPAQLDCSQAARAVELTKRMGKDLLTFTDDGDLVMPRLVWEHITEAERLALAQIVGQARRCRASGAADAAILASGTGEILYKIEAAQ